MARDDRRDESSGLWQIYEDVPVDDDGGRTANSVYVFSFDGDTVTLRLLTPRPGQWRSADDFYRLDAEWRNDSLWYHPPFGDWVELATFEDGHFVDLGSGRKRTFSRIEKDELADRNRPILAPRDPHDYRTRADDVVQRD